MRSLSGILASVSLLGSVKRGHARGNRLVGSRTSDRVDMPEQTYKIETEQEDDGRWIAEIVDLAGVMAYGSSEQEAIANAEALALRVIADRIEETKIGTSRVSFASP